MLSSLFWLVNQANFNFLHGVKHYSWFGERDITQENNTEVFWKWQQEILSWIVMTVSHDQEISCRALLTINQKSHNGQSISCWVVMASVINIRFLFWIKKEQWVLTLCTIPYGGVWKKLGWKKGSKTVKIIMIVEKSDIFLVGCNLSLFCWLAIDV